jgi:hypothetical protein
MLVFVRKCFDNELFNLSFQKTASGLLPLP